MDVSYEKALVHCTAQGARLCSANELQNDVARGTGCGFDTRLVWTSESCMLEPGIYGKIVTGGSSKYNGTTSAACYLKNGDIDVVAQGRCCADFNWQRSSNDFTGVYPPNDYGEYVDWENGASAGNVGGGGGGVGVPVPVKRTSDGIWVFVILLFAVVAVAAAVHYYRAEKARNAHMQHLVAASVVEAGQEVQGGTPTTAASAAVAASVMPSPHRATYATDANGVPVLQLQPLSAAATAAAPAPRNLEFKPTSASMKSTGEVTRFVHGASQMFNDFSVRAGSTSGSSLKYT